MPVKELGCQVHCLKSELCITGNQVECRVIKLLPTHLPASVSHNGITFHHVLQENKANSGHSVLGIVLKGLLSITQVSSIGCEGGTQGSEDQKMKVVEDV